jgi:hypothetical protein
MSGPKIRDILIAVLIETGEPGEAKQRECVRHFPLSAF